MEAVPADSQNSVYLSGEPTITRGGTIIAVAEDCFSPVMSLTPVDDALPNDDVMGHALYKYLERSQQTSRELSMRVPASIDTGRYRFAVACVEGWDVVKDEHEVVIDVTGPKGPLVPPNGLILEHEPTVMCTFRANGTTDSQHDCEDLSPYPTHWPG